MAIDPTNDGVIYIAAAGGGVWKTTDGGVTWTALTDNLPDSAMGALAIDPTNSSVIYAGSGEANFSGDSRYGAGIYKSTDGGSTWSVYTGPNNAFFGLSISKIVVDPITPANVYLTTVYAGDNGTSSAYGVFKSVDAGVTWTRVLQASGGYAYTDLAIDPTNSQTLYTAAGNIHGGSTNGIYKTINGGASWTLLTGFPNGTQSGNDVGRISLALAPSNPQVLYADYSSAGGAAAFGSLGGFWTSHDGGATWTQLPPSTDGTGNTGVPNFLGDQGWYDNTIIVNPTNANEVFAAGQVNYGATKPGQYVAIIGSYDGGSTWDDYTYGTNYSGPHTDHHALMFTADGTTLLDGNDGGVWRCENPNTDQAMGSIEWTNLNTNLNITQFTGVALHPINNNIAYGGSQDNGTEEYTGSLDWTQVRGGDGGFTRVDQTTPTTVYHEYYGISLERSDDGGQNWTNIAGTTGINPNDPSIDGADPAAFYVPYILDPADQSRILYGTNHMYESVNRGTQFTVIGTPGVAGFNPSGHAVTALAANGSTIYAYASGAIYVTTNDGVSWTTSAPPGGGYGVSDIYVNPANTLDVTVARGAFNGGHVYHSVDGGGSWVDISGNLPNEPFSAVKVDQASGILFAGGDDGVYFSTNSGGSWARANFPEVQVVDLAISPGAGIIAAGTHGRGAFVSPLPVPPTARPIISSALTAAGTIGQPFSYQITATNYPESFGAGGLPAGLSLNPSTGVVAGTPTVSGTFPVTLSATNTIGTGTATLTLTIAALQPVVTSALKAATITGQPFNYQITASNYPVSFGASGLPAGLSLNPSTGVIAGAPTVAGTFPVTLSATNTAGTGTATLTLTITAIRPVVNSALTAAGTIGQPFSYQITALNYPMSFGVSGLPAGLSLNTATGVITGTPTASGAVPVGLGAINIAGVGIATLTLTIAPVPPVVNSALTAAGTVGQPFSYQITAGYDPTSFGATGLPPGLKVDTATGFIAGTPAVSGFYPVTLRASSATGIGTATLGLTIAAVAPVVSSATAVTATVHSPLQYRITAGYTPTSFGATGLPPGLIVNEATGLISGTPSELGVFPITVSASNATGTGTSTLMLQVALPVVTIEILAPSVRVGSGRIGEFKLQMSSPLSTAVTVRYRIRGDAVNGVDYVRLSGVKTFAAGQTSKLIRIRPKGDLEGAKEKDVKLRLESGPGYTPSPKKLVKVEILAAQ